MAQDNTKEKETKKVLKMNEGGEEDGRERGERKRRWEEGKDEDEEQKKMKDRRE